MNLTDVKLACLLLGLAVLPVLFTAAENDPPTTGMRTWVSASGSTVEAEFVSVKFDDVLLRRADGKELRIRMQQLSSADQIHVRNVSVPSTQTRKSAQPAAGNSSSALEKLFGKDLVNAKKETVSTANISANKIGIYFSAHWCGPCRAFTPQLVEVYKQWNADGKPFEIVFVSSDKDEPAMYHYMNEAGMPWLAVPFGSDTAGKLKERFNVSGIPKFVVVNGSGKTITDTARGDVAQHGLKAYGKW